MSYLYEIVQANQISILAVARLPLGLVCETLTVSKGRGLSEVNHPGTNMSMVEHDEDGAAYDLWRHDLHLITLSQWRKLKYM